MIEISIVVTTYKAIAHLHCCVKSLARTRQADEIEVVIYGDGGGAVSLQAIEECAAILSQQGIACVFRYEAQNLGICPALNAAVALAKGKWLFIVNDDMVFPADWWVKCKPLLKSGRILSTSAIEPDLPGRHVARCFITRTLGLNPESFDFEILEKAQTEIANRPLEVGVNYPFFVERELFLHMGGVDERYPGPYHDPDLFLRFRNAQLEMVRTMAVAPYHFSGVSLRFGEEASKIKATKTKAWIKKEMQARLLFIKKWGAKPKSRFGEIPKSRALKEWNQEPHSLWERCQYTALLQWEKLRGFWRVYF
jgi:glycosyltransferase involved in cell wall biosynthesis